jgi:hypothetical protein
MKVYAVNRTLPMPLAINSALMLSKVAYIGKRCKQAKTRYSTSYLVDGRKHRTMHQKKKMLYAI